VGHRDLPEVIWQPRIALDAAMSRRTRVWVDARAGVIDTTRNGIGGTWSGRSAIAFTPDANPGTTLIAAAAAGHLR